MVSTQLRRYYFKVVVNEVMMGLWEVGYECSPPQTHAYLKHEFLQVWTLDETNWCYLCEDGSTKELSNKEFIAYIERIQRWAALYLNVVIPDPNEVTNELNELK